MMHLAAFVTAQAGWLQDLTTWFRKQIERFWDAIVQFFNDLIILAIKAVLELVVMAFERLPVPDFMQQYSIGGLLGNAGSTVGWFVQTFRIGECLAVIALGIAFKITRKILTLGKW
ncbi:MAG: hypothetical protein ACN6OP_11095 [Pseudomonadales bacterium]